MPVKFPPVNAANEDGLLAIGGKLNVETLTLAYSQGIFPWPVGQDYPNTWFAPDPRGVILFKDFHIPKSLKKFLRKNPYQIRFNEDFPQIIRRCADAKRSHEDGTWINQEIVKAYGDMFADGKAYCVGAYDEEGCLVGGLYGVCLGEIVSGESMFFESVNASKACLMALIERLQESGLEFLDTQMVTPVVAAFGGKLIRRSLFMGMIERLDSSRPRNDIF